MLGICLSVGLVIAGQAQTQEKDAKTRPWAVIARRQAMAAKVYATADPVVCSPKTGPGEMGVPR
jgi:hypothetical protein